MSLNSNTINNFATTIKKGGMCSKIDMISCLVSTLVYAYLVRLINNPITTKKPPLDGGWMVAEPPLDGGRMAVEPSLDDGWMTDEMSVGLIKYISYSPPLDGGRMEAEVTVGVVK